MKPVQTKGTNSIFGANGYIQLPAQVYIEEDLMGEGQKECVQTVWELSDDELALINETKRIYVSTVGNVVQPIALDVVPFVNE